MIFFLITPSKVFFLHSRITYRILWNIFLHVCSREFYTFLVYYRFDLLREKWSRGEKIIFPKKSWIIKLVKLIITNLRKIQSMAEKKLVRRCEIFSFFCNIHVLFVILVSVYLRVDGVWMNRWPLQLLLLAVWQVQPIIAGAALAHHPYPDDDGHSAHFNNVQSSQQPEPLFFIFSQLNCHMAKDRNEMMKKNMPAW